MLRSFFYNGKADCICYEKAEVNSTDRHIKFSEDEVQRVLEKRTHIQFSEDEIQCLLEINGGERKWKEPKTISETGSKKWETEDGEFLATYLISSILDNFPLYIQTKENHAREEAKSKAEELKRKAKAKADVKKALKGFEI